MNSTHEVISAFLDDRPFDPAELADALNDPAGRALLIDLVVLRRIVQPTDPVPAMTRPRAASRQPWRVVAAAAALVLTLAGGYLAGARREATVSIEAPPPTRTVAAVPFIPEGGLR
jgi:hypothetical protein